MTIRIERGVGFDFLELEISFVLTMGQYRVSLGDWSWTADEFNETFLKQLSKRPDAYGITIEKAIDQWLLDAGLVERLDHRYSTLDRIFGQDQND